MGFHCSCPLSQRGNKCVPSADSLYFLQFLVLVSGALVPVPVPLEALGRAPLLKLLLARRLRKLPTHQRRRSLQSPLFLSAPKRMSIVESP